MAANSLQIRVLLSALDKVTSPLKRIMAGSNSTAKALKAARDQVKALNAQQSDVSSYTRQHEAVRKTGEELARAQQQLRKYKEQLKAMDVPSAAFQKTFTNASAAVDRLKNKHSEQRTELQRLIPKLREAGINTRNLSESEKQLKTRIDAANTAYKTQQQRMETLAGKQERLARVREKYAKGKAFAGSAAMVGAGSVGAAYGMAHVLRDPLEEGKHFTLESNRVAALGLGDEATKDAIKYAKAMKTYGTSTTENLTLVRDAMTVFADEHHAELVAPTLAKMKFANHAMYGEEEGAENERKFMDMLKVIELRGGLASPEAFGHQADIVQKILTATGGRVGPNEWLNVIKTGGVAAKGLTDDAFYNQLEPLVQEMGGHRVGTAMMSAYSNIYQGRTTKRAANNLAKLGLVDESKVKHDKVGQIAFLDVGAIKGSKLFATNQFEWMEKILLPQLKAKGITDKQQVIDTIGSIFSNRTASNLFAQMYLQREQIHKNASLNRGADGIDQLYAKGQQIASGQEMELLAKRADLYKELGDTLLPTYLQVLKAVTDVAKGMTAWIKENPATAAIVMKVALGVGALTAGFGALTIAMASLIGPFAILRYGMGLMGLRSVGLLGTLFQLAKTALPMVATAIRIVGVAAVATPIGAVLSAIALAATLIYQNWSTVGPWFASLWQEIKTGFSNGIAGVAGLLANFSPLGLMYSAWSGVLNYLGIELPAKFTGFGGMIIDGLINGMTGQLGALRDSVVNVAGTMWTSFKEKMGIHSPSRVFAQLGDFTMQGLAVGLAKGEDGPLSQMASTAKRLTAAGAVAVGAGMTALPAAAGVTFDDRPPAAQASAPLVIQGDTVTIHITAGPGVNTRDLAQQIGQVLDQREREKAARLRSRLSDKE